MRLDWAILSNSAEIQGGLSYVLGGGWDTGYRPAFPAPFFGALTLRLMVHPTEVASAHRLEVRVWNADGADVVAPLTLNVGPGAVPENSPRGWEIPAIFAIGLQALVIPAEGQYSFEILVDDHHLKSLPFRFIQGSPPAEPAAPLPPQE